MNIIEQIKAEIERRIKELHEAEIDYREDQCDAIVSCLVSGIGELQRVLTFLNTLEKSLPAKVVDGNGLNGEIERYFEGWSDDSEYGQAVMRNGACAGVDECKDISRHFAQWGAEHLADARKTSPKDLESYAQRVEDYYDVGEGRGYLCTHRGDIKDAVIAGAKWQKEQDDKELSEKIAAAYQLGLADKEKQMLKEAVKMYPCYDEEHNLVGFSTDYEAKGAYGQLTRIIIVKEDEK